LIFVHDLTLLIKTGRSLASPKRADVFLWADKNMVELLEANESLFVGFHSFASHGERNIRYLSSNADH
jgi:hypothetical protein